MATSTRSKRRWHGSERRYRDTKFGQHGYRDKPPLETAEPGPKASRREPCSCDLSVDSSVSSPIYQGTLKKARMIHANVERL